MSIIELFLCNKFEIAKRYARSNKGSLFYLFLDGRFGSL